jgi:signal transduction histidine kinase
MTSTVSGQSPATILVADDDATIRFMLRHLLESEIYTVVEATDGEQATDLIQQSHFDLILLDAIMPKKDGFEICANLQLVPANERQPVLINTGLEDEETVDRAFEVGAVDYVTKPMHWPVLRQRVRRLISTKQLEKMRDDLIQMIVHDMKNPISTIRGFAEMMLLDVESETVLADSLQRIYHSSNNLLDMTMMILDIGRLEDGKLVPQPSERNVRQVLEEVKDSFGWMASNYHVTIEINACDPEFEFLLDWGLIQRVVANLVSNAIKHSPPDTKVTLSCDQTESPKPSLRLSVTDHGEGIAEQDRVSIFEKFSQATRRKHGSRTDTGLGLTFCKLATEAHGGKIELESAVDMGSTFTLVFER